MKKTLLSLFVVFILISCNNDNMENETGPFSLIGTWEAEGETYNIPFKCTLVFLNETDFEQEAVYTKPNSEKIFYTPKGTYIREENNIIYTEIGEHASNKYTHPYKFINKNTLETFGIGFMDWDIEKMTFKRKD
jgi:hypothetical protein